MAGETGAIRRDIAQTREEIDDHLRELGGTVRGEFDIKRQARRNLPQLIWGGAIAGLTLGILIGHGRREERRSWGEEARLAREWRRLARERGRMRGAVEYAEVAGEEVDIP